MLLLLGVHSECLVQQRRSTLSDYVTVVGGSFRMPGAAKKEHAFRLCYCCWGFTPNAWCSKEEARFQIMLLLLGVHSECLMQQRRSTLSDDVTVVGGSLRMPGAATKKHAFRLCYCCWGFTPNAWCSKEGARFQIMLLLLGVHSECLVQQRRSPLSDYVIVVGGSLRMFDAATKEARFQIMLLLLGGSLRMPGAATEEHAFR